MRDGLSLLKRFARDDKGNFLIIGALSAVVLVAAMGGAVDFSRQSRAHAALQSAADAGALAGAKLLETDINALPDAQVAMMVRANLPDELDGATITTSVDRTRRIITVRAAAQVDPAFLPIVDINALPVDVLAASSIQKPQFNDFYFMLDVSESMNIAASDADRDKLEHWTNIERKGEPCAFACHVSDWYRPKSAYQVARDHGVRLRIDVLQDAADKMIDKILAENAGAGTLKSNRVATFGFSWDFQKGLDPSTNGAALKSSIRTFWVANDHTRFWWAFSSFNTALGTQGTGDTSTSRKKFAIVVTDGVKDENFDINSGLGPLDPSLCAAIKNKGIPLAVMEIKYIARPAEYFFNERVKPYYTKISPSLEKCASPGLYLQASDADEASRKLLALTETLMMTHRQLTQ